MVRVRRDLDVRWATGEMRSRVGRVGRIGDNFVNAAAFGDNE